MDPGDLFSQKLNGPFPLSPPSSGVVLSSLGAAEDFTVMLRSRALTIPLVTVLASPSGAPIAMVTSPTLSWLESAKAAGWKVASLLILITARSVIGSVPTSFALYRWPS